MVTKRSQHYASCTEWRSMWNCWSRKQLFSSLLCNQRTNIPNLLLESKDHLLMAWRSDNMKCQSCSHILQISVLETVDDEQLMTLIRYQVTLSLETRWCRQRFACSVFVASGASEALELPFLLVVCAVVFDARVLLFYFEVCCFHAFRSLYHFLFLYAFLVSRAIIS